MHLLSLSRRRDTRSSDGQCESTNFDTEILHPVKNPKRLIEKSSGHVPRNQRIPTHHISLRHFLEQFMGGFDAASSNKRHKQNVPREPVLIRDVMKNSDSERDGAKARVEAEEPVAKEGVAMEAGLDEMGVDGLSGVEGAEREAAINEVGEEGDTESSGGSQRATKIDH
ncbi:unnamed protein product, partial [Musa acuminata subsp. malaccensis]